jgi:uncharacterized protein (DUF2237 family)
MTVAFLNFQFERGNDLTTPRPDHHFQGLKPGDPLAWLQENALNGVG